MDYTLHQLKIFLKVVEHQSVTKAAEELFLTQPAVSIQLKKFQDQFAIPLTEVVGRKLYVSDFGQEIARSAEKILDEIETINYKTKSFKGQLAGRLKLSIVSTAKYVMPYFVSGFMRQHQGVDLVIDVTNKTQVVNSLELNEVDFSMVSVIPEQLKLNRVQLMQNKLYLVGGASIQRPASMRTKDIFEKYPLLYREQGSATRHAMETFISEKKMQPFKKIELTSNEALKQAMIAGLGFSIMPLIGIKNELNSGDLEVIPYRGLPIITHWNLVWQQAKKLSPVAEAYLEYVMAEKGKIIKGRFDWYEKY